jgi:hypothetical protein
MSLGTSEALRELLSACRRADQVAALHTLGLHPGLINERWAGETFDVAGVAGLGEYVLRGETAIMLASKGGNEALVLELVKRGAEVNARNEIGCDALMNASRSGHTAVVAVLLNHGADPNTRNYNWTALGLAAANDHLPICLLLVARAADLYAVNAVNGTGQNALEGYGSFKYLRLAPVVLVERRAQLKHAYDQGPHPNARWARRKSFVMVLATASSLTMFLPVAFPYDFQPTAARRAVLSALYPALPPNVRIPPLPAGTPEQKRALLNMSIFGHDGLWKLIASFL